MRDEDNFISDSAEIRKHFFFFVFLKFKTGHFAIGWCGLVAYLNPMS